MTDLTRYEEIDDIAVIRLDDGKANAFGPPMIAAVDAELDRAGESAKAVVLTGRDGMFSGGFDLKVIQGGDGTAAREMATAGARLMMRLYDLPQPLVIAASGHAIALGAICALTGDHRIGIHGEFRMGLNEVAIGSTLPPFAWLLAKDRLSKRYLTQAVVTANIYTHAGALDAGFLDELVEPAALLDTALAKARQLAELPAHAYAGMKHELRGEGIAGVLAGLDD